MLSIFSDRGIWPIFVSRLAARLVGKKDQPRCDFFVSNDSLKYFFDTEHQLESIFGDFQFKSAKPYDSGSMASDNFPAPNLLPCERIWQRWKGNDPIFSLFFDNRWKKNRFRKRNLVRFFIFICCQKKIGDATKCFFVAATLPKPKKLITLKEILFNAATILLQRCQATKIW